MDKVRVLVADEENLFREGVCALLRACEDIDVVGEATNGEEAIEMARQQTPDVVLTDMTMPIMDGTEVTRQIRNEKRDIKVLLLTQYEDSARILSGLKAGAHGYIPKRATASDLVSVIMSVYRGGSYLYPSIAKKILVDCFEHTGQWGGPNPYERPTHGEQRVLKPVAEGRKSSEIAELLMITDKTVLVHRRNIMGKLNIHNRTELIKYAICKQLIELAD